MDADDLFELADLAAEPGDDGRPCLLELGRRLDGGAVRSRLLRWTGSPLAILVPASGGRVRVRDADNPSADLDLTRVDLVALVGVVQRWARDRDTWWAFVQTWERGYALPPPPRRYYYLAPDIGAKTVDVGGPWTAGEIRVPVVPVVPMDGATKTANIIVPDQRVGACDDTRAHRIQRPGTLPPGTRVGPPVAVVGETLELATGLLVATRRLTIEIGRGGARLTLVPDDAEIFRELVALLDDDRTQR
jgi:hypothetical protein